VASNAILTGRTLRAARLAAGKTMAELGAAIGVSESAVSRWEAGSRAVSGPATLALMHVLPALHQTPRSKRKPTKRSKL
jgi:transcriptional regulator with XRE-family HTH domain